MGLSICWIFIPVTYLTVLGQNIDISQASRFMDSLFEATYLELDWTLKPICPSTSNEAMKPTLVSLNDLSNSQIDYFRYIPTTECHWLKENNTPNLPTNRQILERNQEMSALWKLINKWKVGIAMNITFRIQVFVDGLHRQTLLRQKEIPRTSAIGHKTQIMKTQ